MKSLACFRNRIIKKLYYTVNCTMPRGMHCLKKLLYNWITCFEGPMNTDTPVLYVHYRAEKTTDKLLLFFQSLLYTQGTSIGFCLKVLAVALNDQSWRIVRKLEKVGGKWRQETGWGGWWWWWMETGMQAGNISTCLSGCRSLHPRLSVLVS